jgi:hypothetical protein
MWVSSHLKNSKNIYVSTTRMVAALRAAELGGFAISSKIDRNKRGRPSLSCSKQLAAYLVHVSLSISYTTISSHFHCDRGTIEAACGRVEDLRDNVQLDTLINLYETALFAWAHAFAINSN